MFILKNAADHAAASVNINDETCNNDIDAPHDASDDDIEINNLSDVEESALAHDTCMDQNIHPPFELISESVHESWKLNLNSK